MEGEELREVKKEGRKEEVEIKSKRKSVKVGGKGREA